MLRIYLKPDRLWRTLKRRFQYDLTLKPGQEFLLSHVNSKILPAIIHEDLIGSTNMSTTLPI